MPWWDNAVIYQIYLRSFADGNGDGIGDIAGLRSRLPYLAALGVDAVWLTPWYRSPMADSGYDIADHCAIDPAYGNLGAADALVREAHDAGLRLIIDLVPNHCSSAHWWFQAASSSPTIREMRSLFHIRPGRGNNGDDPPNDWQSWFGGPAWTRLPDGEWYLHLFSPEQPDLNWDNPLVHQEFRSILRFWLDRGVDGFRVDVAHALVKARGLPDAAGRERPPYEDQDGVHDIYRDWRAVVDSASGERALIGEVWPADSSNTPLYVRPDEMHGVFNFDFLCCPWDPTALREVIDHTIERFAAVGAPSSWVLGNHDVTRVVTRYGRTDTAYDVADRRHGWPSDPALGRRRARAAALLMLALPGAAYVYQGDELGLPEVEDLPVEALRDPVVARSGGANKGRDGCRVPLPWAGSTPPYGFCDPLVGPWLPPPRDWAPFTVAAQEADEMSMLALYRAALALRRGMTGPLVWLPSGPGILAFSRGSWQCWVNLSQQAVRLPADTKLQLTSEPVLEGWLGCDAGAWLSD